MFILFFSEVNLCQFCSICVYTRSHVTTLRMVMNIVDISVTLRSVLLIIIRHLRSFHGLQSPCEYIVSIVLNSFCALSRSVVGPGARKPLVGEGIVSRKTLVCSFCLFSPVCTYTGVLNNNNK